VVLGQLAILNDAGEPDPKQIGKFLEELLGAEILQDMMENKVSWKQLEELLNWLLVQYAVIPDPNAVGGEADDEDPDSPK
jgi:hypothetical protein